MKILKRVLLALMGIIVVLLVVALFVKKEYVVERFVVIKKPNKEVFDYVKHLKNQDYYSKWQQMDPNMRKEYVGTDGTVGFVSSWDSNKKDVGKGEQEIMKIVEGERIDIEVRFQRPFEATDDAYIATTPIDTASTRVLWGFSGKVPYPINLMTLVYNMDEEVGEDLETNLNNLKTLMEAM